MRIISNIYLLPAICMICPAFGHASYVSTYASSLNYQNHALESRPQAAEYSKRPVSPLTKLAAVHFITNDGLLTFEGQEFQPGDLCLQNGYTFKGCPANFIAKEPCPCDASYFKECIDPSNWCRDNGYTITSCDVPTYLKDPCPNDNTLFKSCETDNIKACKDLGYSLTCEDGKIGDPNQTCPYNSSYKKCICNPCTGYAYTASEATAQGYIMGDSCNSCGTLKYKRTPNPCDGFLECTEGGASGASVCYSGSIKKFSECKVVCDAKFKYDSTNCTGGSSLAGESCGGKYEKCLKKGLILYSDKTTSYDYIPEKTAIGIVVDEANKLAVAINNFGYKESSYNSCLKINEGNTNATQEDIISTCIYAASYAVLEWGNYDQLSVIQVDVPDLENCNECSSSCAPSGKENTAKVLAFGKSKGLTYNAFNFANNYQPIAGCSSGSWCGKGNWFVPSMRELRMVHKSKDAIKDTLKLIPNSEQIIFDGYKSGYTSSNERLTYIPDAYSSRCSFDMNEEHWADPTDDWSFGPKVNSASFVLPMIQY